MNRLPKAGAYIIAFQQKNMIKILNILETNLKQMSY